MCKGVFLNTLTASKNCRTCAYHCANYFSVHRRMILYPTAIMLTPRTSGSDSPFARSANTVHLYLKTFLLLTNIFKNFREICIASYGFDPTTPCLVSRFTMLKHIRIRFELLIDIDMFIERGICDSLNQCSDRYAQTNNKYMFIQPIETVVVPYVL